MEEKETVKEEENERQQEDENSHTQDHAKEDSTENEQQDDEQTEEQSETEQLSHEEAIDKINELNETIATLEEEKEKLTDRLLRLQAEYENYKRRTNEERIAERKYKSQDLANELLPVLDNFERALQVEVTEANKSVIDGITMVYNQFLEAFKAEGIEEIKTENEPFDPNVHHAVMQVEDDEYESNMIVEELQKGYKIKDRVIRPAMVKVNK